MEPFHSPIVFHDDSQSAISPGIFLILKEYPMDRDIQKYRVGHFNPSTQITPKVIAKNNSYKSCRVEREAIVDDLELEVDFQSHFKINKYFFNGNPYF